MRTGAYFPAAADVNYGLCYPLLMTVAVFGGLDPPPTVLWSENQSYHDTNTSFII